jgi:NADP-dependent 3-hydroxy acid dehydrogenase YdfG
MPFPYKKVLVVGATSGIGEDLASRILKESPSTSIIAVGRRQEKLDEFVEKHSKDRAVAVQFDITNLKDIPDFAQK